MYRPKVYTASKIHHREMWLALSHAWPEIEFTARWLEIDGPDHNTTFWTEGEKTLHWIQDDQDVKRSDWVVAYIEPERDKLSGTLVEIGMSIARCTPVLTVGFSDVHSWQAHPLVLRQSSCAEAFRFITGRP